MSSSGESVSGSSNSSRSAAACDVLSSQTEGLADEAGIHKDKDDDDMEISTDPANTPLHTPQRLCEQADVGSSRAPLSQPGPASTHLDSPDERGAGEGKLTDEEESSLSTAAAPQLRTSGRRRRARSSGSPSEDNLSMTGLMDSDSEAASNASQSGKYVRITSYTC